MLVGQKSLKVAQSFKPQYREVLDNVDAQTVLEHYNARNVFERDGRYGKELVHSCLIDTVKPHHNNRDESPSASLSENLLWNCWSYGGGDILWFIQEMEDVERWQALEILAGFVVDTDKPRKSYSDRIKEIYNRGELASAPIPKYSTIILEPWLVIHPYMTDDRFFKEETLQRYCIGYDPEYEQIVIPHFWKGKLVGYQKRRLDSPNWPQSPAVDKNGKFIPKYKNSKDFPKDKTLYNYDFVMERNCKSVTVVESVMSVLRAESWYDAGYEDWGNVLCTFGGKVTDAQVEILKDFEEITLMMDNDSSGWHGTLKLYTALKDYCRVRIVSMPEGLDLGDLDLADALITRTSSKPGSLVIHQFRKKVREIHNDS